MLGARVLSLWRWLVTLLVCFAAAQPHVDSVDNRRSSVFLPDAAVTVNAAPPHQQQQQQQPSLWGMLAGLSIGLFTVVPRLLYSLITFVTLTIPTWLFSFLSTSLTFTMNMTTLLLVLLAFASTVSWFVRYRFLNMYSRLPPEPQRKEPQIEIFPDSQESDSKPGLANYFEEFLSAIKVFGYLERPVFHELTRTMQTKKLIAGETFSLEDEKGFCLVVDGLVQIFVKSNRGSENDSSSGYASAEDELIEDRPSHHHNYQLLTEVKNGAPMSSLFSILALFTENVKLRYDGAMRPSNPSDSAGHFGFPELRSPLLNLDGSTTPTSGAESPAHGNFPSSRPTSRHRRFSAMNKEPPELHLDREHTPNGSQSSNRKHQASAHPDIVARASVDTTIAVIPASAFQRITRIYPKASAHIVQVILTRLQRVTLATAHTYLGLTTEVLRTERLMDRYTSYDLPDFLRGDALARLKEKFTRDQERIGAEESMKGIALHNPRGTQRKRSSTSLLREAAVHSRFAVRQSTAHVSDAQADRIGMSAGDLLTNIHAARSSGHRRQVGSFSQPYSLPKTASTNGPKAVDASSPDKSPSSPQRPYIHRQESLDEDSVFRESILECMFKSIGLTNNKDALRKPESAAQSPRLVSFDPKRQSAVFNNAFGFIDPYDGSQDDSESVASASAYSIGGSANFLHDLKSDVEIVYFPQGSVLVEEGERNPGLYYVIDGFLDVSSSVDEENANKDVFGTKQNESHLDIQGILTGNNNQRPPLSARSTTGLGGENQRRKKARKSLFVIKPGGLAGYLGTVSSYRSFIDVTAKTDVYVGFLPRFAIEKIVERYPIVLLTMAKRLTSLLPRLILHIDFALEWVQVNAGQTIYHQNDESDAIYIVLNGRLRGIQEGENGKMKVLGEYGQGDSVGELEVLTESTRPGGLHAIRDTELAKFPKMLFNSLAQEHPGITIKVSKIIAARMRALIESPMTENPNDSKLGVTRQKVNSTINLRTVAIVPCTAGVPVVEFGNKLLAALHQIGTVKGVTMLSQSTILNHLGRHAFSRMGKLKLSQYLADLEEKHGLVIYVADTNVNSAWTQTCISQADCIYLVGLAEGTPGIGEYERFLLTTKTTARKELVLLHSERYCPPGTTRLWMKNRPWINGGHHHVQMAFRNAPAPVPAPTKRFGNALKQRVQVLQAEIHKYTSRRVRQTPLYSADTPFKGDFHRLARRLCGKSVGLVLGGGGARGLAHVGVIRALEEAGLPIDIVGGTSIGSFIGAVYAQDADVVPMYGRVKKFAGRMGSMWRFVLDVTYPSASYTTGHEFNRGIFKTFGDSQIEDFWLEYYCNSTNISKSRSEIHTSGYVWRYVRASMSLAGLLPPICDEGHMLLDGGYTDNLTVLHMKSLGADAIFAVDVGALDDDSPQAYGDSLSGIWASLNRWNPFSSHPNPPTLAEIQARLAYVSSVDNLERSKNIPGCYYMRPPIEAYGTLEFAKFDEIYQVGYQYGKKYLSELRDQGVLPVLEETEEKKNLRRTMAPRRASI
ncbi:Lysophospholipase NTE1 [Acrodontium crateriforme]|uniref:Lysophospholipase NTE1 n=1 Tax=Acrodontium crateriforme TaxID=150365 RepID=A0AAQ3M8P4_9PEZI|nr:Lysophospholipase NTE1 [Acrodontium crateriforme]